MKKYRFILIAFLLSVISCTTPKYGERLRKKCENSQLSYRACDKYFSWLRKQLEEDEHYVERHSELDTCFVFQYGTYLQQKCFKERDCNKYDIWLDCVYLQDSLFYEKNKGYNRRIIY